MTTDELIAWVSEQAARAVADASVACGEDEWVRAEREYAAMLTSVESALRRLREIERDHGGEL